VWLVALERMGQHFAAMAHELQQAPAVPLSVAASLAIPLRELMVAARQKQMFRTRLLVSGGASALALLLVWGLQGWRAWSGQTAFVTLAWAALAFCLLEGIRCTASSIATERREGTLGLLFLTDLRAFQVVLGKLAAASVSSGTILLALLPAFSLPMLTGGVSQPAFWGVALSLVLLLALSLSAGLLASTLTTSSLAAAGGTALLLILTLAGPALWNYALGDFFILGGPWEMFGMAVSSRIERAPALFWTAAAFSVVLCFIYLATASWLLSRFWRWQPAFHPGGLWERWLRPRPGMSGAWGGGTAEHDPAVWLAERTLPGRRTLWLLVWIAAGACFLTGLFSAESAHFVLIAIQLFFGFALKLWVALVAPQSLNRASRSGALETILCTPLPGHAIVRGQIDALSNYFIGPAFCVATGFPMAMLGGSLLSTALTSGPQEMEIVVLVIPWAMIWMLIFLLDLHALAYVGLWNGLKQSRPERAAARTAFAVLVVPWLTVVLVPFFGIAGIVGWPLFWIYWGKRRLQGHFRTGAAECYAAA
jgi:hypothetical protein